MFRKTSAICLSALVLATGCDYVTPNLNAAYIEELGTYAKRAELVGALYHLDTTQSPPRLQALEERIVVNEADLETIGTADLSSSRITGASADLIEAGKVVASNVSLEFEAKMDAEDADVNRLSVAKAAQLIRAHYTTLRSELAKELGREPEFSELPMDLPQIADKKGQYYVMVTGGDSAKKLDISFGAPEGSTNGFSLTVGGKKLSGVEIRGSTSKTCSQPKNRTDRARCSVSIEAFSATLNTPQSKLRVRPATLPTKVIADAFRAK
jgi:hypothetical protein